MTVGAVPIMAVGRSLCPPWEKDRVRSLRVYFEEAGGFVDCPVYDRARLRPENVIPGPAIVEQMDATTVILPGQRASVDPWSNLFISTET